MCEVLILMLNSFYRVYYQLFDLCEHTLISVLILLVVLICFIPALFKTEEQRPLFTIFVLVCGVVGGLIVVISVVYLYRYCLKRRNPVTTTVNPDFKREHIRSVVVGLSRPLPLPQEFLNSSTPKHTSTTTLGFEDEHDIDNSISVVPLIVTNDSNYALRLSQNTYNTLLSVSPAPTRAHSAELHPPEVSDEVRRSSFEVQRGTGRQLPSTEGLEQHHQFEHDRQRRMSHFARSNAVHYAAAPPPRKQVSSPLPEIPRRIYERGHAHSRSWNPGAQPSPPPLLDPNTYHQFYEPVIHSTAPDAVNDPYILQVSSSRRLEVPIIQEPLPPTPHNSERRRSHLVPRQAKSFETNPVDRRHMLDHRSYTLASSQAAAEAQREEVSAACQSLWAAKGHLEQLDALGISEPSSVSTSFESNTDSQATADTVERQASQVAKAKRSVFNKACHVDSEVYGSLPHIKKRLTLEETQTRSYDSRKNSARAWSKERKKNNLNILLQRQFLSTAAVSSMESNNSTDDSDQRFSNSFDSMRSELERRRLSLLNQTDANSSDEACSSSQRMNNRDYSVDVRSDHLFREWSRVDPAYDPLDRRLQRGHTVDHSAMNQHRQFQRQFSLTTSPIAQTPPRRQQTMVSYRN
ncbi:Protein CBG20803 [Caenorhabditis briggsae]|uniref:Protein CBG20803 n=1 Tax=Caenorhabditis briggsae TaxID=6238 RepID=A8XYN4_CAEBR|nr:Protein CBG20803 [Caenorhabditis briggsae]CAP37750.1 Protein CBG20803 [Caenorhabditis briggsae]